MVAHRGRDAAFGWSGARSRILADADVRTALAAEHPTESLASDEMPILRHDLTRIQDHKPAQMREHCYALMCSPSAFPRARHPSAASPEGAR